MKATKHKLMTRKRVFVFGFFMALFMFLFDLFINPLILTISYPLV